MKNLFLPGACLVALLAARPAAAQYTITPNLAVGQNPGKVNTDAEERFDQSPQGWTPLLIGSSIIQSTPRWSGVQTLPFTFQFNKQSFTSYKVSSSGVLTFSTAAPTAPPTANEALPSALIPDNSVCIWGTQLTASNDYLTTKTFGTAPNRQQWIQFNSASLPTGSTSTPLPGSAIYCAIVLEETSNRVYLVWQRSGPDAQTLTAGLQLSGTAAVQVSASPEVSFPNLTDASSVDNVYYEFVPEAQGALDLVLRRVSLPVLASSNAAIPVTGVLLNKGSETVTSYGLGYQVNKQTPAVTAVTGVSIPTATEVGFKSAAPWTPTQPGTYNLKVWLAGPNGQADQDRTNDTLRTSVQVVADSLRRYVVEECFSSSTCGPCRPGNINVEGVNGRNPGKQVVIKYQQNFPAPGNDPYYTLESGARIAYYGYSSIPNMALDGGWNNNSNSLTDDVLNEFWQKPVTMRLKGTYSLTAGKLVTAAATIRPFQAYPAGQLVAHMVVTERRTTRNVRTNGETLFHHVMKKMLPNENGTPLPALAAGQAFKLNQAFDMSTLLSTQAVENFDSLEVIVFVQNLATKQIYQGCNLTLAGPSTVTATRAGQSGATFSLAPNPATGRTALLLTLDRPETTRVEVLDALGRRVLSLAEATLGRGPHQLDLDLSQQAPGVYVVRLTTERGVSTRQLVLN